MQKVETSDSVHAARSGERRYDTLFVVGCPRSGTTWLQLLLAQHPDVVTAPETQIFAFYLSQLERQWAHEHTAPGAVLQGGAGLSRLLSDEEFDELCRRSARFVLDKIAASNPAASLVLEKSPKHALQAEFIQRLIPDARFLHVIRDPRDTVASLRAAAAAWGEGWAPRNPIDGARLWREHVESARRVSARAECYREVSYEALRANPVAELCGILEWLGRGVPTAEAERMVEACRFERLQEAADGEKMPLPARRSPGGFFRKGTVGGWASDLSARQVAAVEHVCGDLMEKAGYRPVSRGRRPNGSVLLHDGVQRIRESIDWQLARLLRHV